MHRRNFLLSTIALVNSLHAQDFTEAIFPKTTLELYFSKEDKRAYNFKNKIADTMQEFLDSYNLPVTVQIREDTQNYFLKENFNL